jgi:hypothetical protein
MFYNEKAEEFYKEDKIWCGKRSKYQDLSTSEFPRSFPRKCLEESECEMENGDVAECKCGMDGNHWC